MKKKVLKYFIASILFFIAIFVANQVQAKSYTIKDMDIQATILEDGGLKVKQQLTYEFNGSYNGIYIDIPDSLDSEEYDRMRKQTTNLKDSLYNATSVQVESVSEIENDAKQEYNKVSSAINGRNGVYTIGTSNGIKRIKIYSPSTNVVKTFEIEFVLNNVCVKHNDVGELYYNFIGGGWETTIQNLNIDIYLPNNESIENLKVFGHGPYQGESKIVSEKQVNLQVKNIKPGQYVAARVVFDNQNIINGTKKSGQNALSIIMQDEQDIYDNKVKKQNFTNKIYIFAGILLIYWIILLVLFEKDKKYEVVSVDEDEIMQKYNPLLAGCIKNQEQYLQEILLQY